MTKPNNPPAFPLTKAVFTNGIYNEVIQEGISLRDAIAIAAMQGILFRSDAADLEIKEGQETVADAISANAYFMADAMLRQREAEDAKT